jgi:hypothetical protein
MSNLTRFIAAKKLLLQAKSPHLLIGIGVVGIVGTIVLACKATLKVNDILDKSKETLDTIENVANDKETYPDYTAEDRIKDRRIVHSKTALTLVRTYAPAAITGVLSLGCIIGSHVILKNRNLGLVAAYSALDKTFKNYRGRVKEKLGEQAEDDLAKGITRTTVTQTNAETGKKEKVEQITRNGYSEHAVLFDSSFAAWGRHLGSNLYFLKCAERFANEKLRMNGYLFLNDVYHMIGAPITEAGAVVGWVMGEQGGDQYVDFGLYTSDNQPFYNSDFEGADVMCDFNVDGTIFDKAPEIARRYKPVE